MSRPRRFLSVLICAVLASTAVGTGAPTPVAAQAAGLGAGGEYHPVTPRVVLDAREGSRVGPVRTPIASTPSGTRTDITVTGVAGVPADPSSVLAVVLAIKVEAATAPGDLVAIAGGVPTLPAASSLAFDRKVPTSSLVVVRPSPSGVVSLGLRSRPSGTAAVRVVVHGWISTSSAEVRGARLMTVPPVRVFGTQRTGLSPGSIVTLPVRGVGPIPNDPSVTAAVVNITVMNERSGSKKTRVSVSTKRPSSPPRLGDIAARVGQTTSTVAIVPLDANGRVHLSNAAGATSVLVDVVGYMRTGLRSDNRRGRIVPLERPFRSFDTRRKDFGSLPIGPGVAEDWDYKPFVESLTYPVSGLRVGPVSTVLGSVTALDHERQYPANPPSSTEVRVYPGTLQRMSSVFVDEDARASNFVVGRLDKADRVKFYNSAGTTHYIFDIAAIILEDA
jgi:hypothetical protein